VVLSESFIDPPAFKGLDVVTDRIGPVPEPPSLLMILVGVAGIGFAGRRARSQVRGAGGRAA
jgi:hypothetical protein